MLRALDIYTRAAMAEDHPGVDDELREQLECNVCTDVLLNPVTTPCGHTFCKECLSRAVDVRNQCPLCRTILLVGACAEIPVNVTLASVISKLLPASLAARRERAAQEAAGTRATDGGVPDGREGLLPIFVMSEMFPYQKMQLNIFEPRYRLLVRRAMEGNRRFGMVEYDRGTRGMKSLGCEVEITQCDPLPDGRFHINITGRRRIRILSSRVQDGYALATVRYLRDDDNDLVGVSERTSIMPDTRRYLGDALAEMESLEDDEYVKSLMSLVQNTARGLQETTSKMLANMHRAPPRMRRHFRAHHAQVVMVLHQVASGVPLETTDAEELSWSLAQATRALDVSNTLGAESFLAIATARERMMIGLHCLCHMIGVAHELSARLDKDTDDGDGEGKENGEDADDDMEEDGDVEEEEEEEEDVDEDEDEDGEVDDEEEEEEEEGEAADDSQAEATR